MPVFCASGHECVSTSLVNLCQFTICFRTRVCLYKPCHCTPIYDVLRHDCVSTCLVFVRLFSVFQDTIVSLHALSFVCLFSVFQDTIVSLQALSLYASSGINSSHVDFNAHGGNFTHTYSVNKANGDLLHRVEVCPIPFLMLIGFFSSINICNSSTDFILVLTNKTY